MNETYKHSTLQDADKTLNAILEVISEGVWDWNVVTGYVHRSPSWYRMLEYKVDFFEKNVFSWENIIHPKDYERVMEHFELYINGTLEKYEIEYRCQKADGAYLWILDRAIKIEYNEEGEVIRMIGAHQNIDSQKTIQNELKEKNKLLQVGNLTLEKLLQENNRELEEKNKELEQKVAEVQYLSYTDTLTQIPNRRKFAMDIEKEVARAKRYGHHLSMIIMDIDYFKNVNDNYGHKVGDSVLRQLSISMQEHLRVNDFIYRWGGEEFAILLPETNAQETIYVAEKLRKYISQLRFEQNLSITCSFGVAQYDKTQTVDQLFINADRALYKAKELGRNRVESVLD